MVCIISVYFGLAFNTCLNRPSHNLPSLQTQVVLCQASLTIVATQISILVCENESSSSTSARWQVFKSIQDHLVTTECFEHQAHLRPVSEHPIWVYLSAQSILGDRQVPSFPNKELNFQFYYYIRLETMQTMQKVLKLFRMHSARLTPPIVLQMMGKGGKESAAL